MLVPFSLTYVRYDDNDAYSLILALFTLSPIFIIVMYATILLIRRDLQTLLILLGQFMNLFLNLLLKHTLNIPRPVESDLLDPGMPSNHCQFISYFCAIYVIQLVKAKDLSVVFRMLYSFYLFLLGFLVCYSRYYLNYHHEDQIIVGVIVGIAFALIWEWFCRVISPLTRFIGQLSICKWLQIRDYSDVNYAPMFEFQATNEALNQLKSSKKAK